LIEAHPFCAPNRGAGPAGSRCRPSASAKVECTTSARVPRPGHVLHHRRCPASVCTTSPRMPRLGCGLRATTAKAWSRFNELATRLTSAIFRIVASVRRFSRLGDGRVLSILLNYSVEVLLKAESAALFPGPSLTVPLLRTLAIPAKLSGAVYEH